MTRNKDYDRHDVLEKAVDVFWQKGYKACSVADIVEATGLNTASMYKEFGDKDGLFEEALQQYRESVLSPRLQLLIDEPNLEGIRAFIRSVVDNSASSGYRGCLMMNHLSQKHSISPRAARKLNDFCKTLEGLLEKAFRNAQAQGESNPAGDPAALASFVVCCLHGMVLYGRYPNKRSNILGLHDIILRALES